MPYTHRRAAPRPVRPVTRDVLQRRIHTESWRDPATARLPILCSDERSDDQDRMADEEAFRVGRRLDTAHHDLQRSGDEETPHPALWLE